MIPATKTFVTRESQSQYDLAIQLYGRFDAIGKILGNLPILDNEVPTGTVVSYEQEDTQAALFFASTLCSTWNPGNIFFRLTETGGFRLLEDGSFRLLE